MSTPAPHNWRYLEPHLGSSYRQLFVKGTRIRAHCLYAWYGTDPEEGEMTAEQLAEDFSLPLEAVREAIAYCETNPPEIEADLRE